MASDPARICAVRPMVSRGRAEEVWNRRNRRQVWSAAVNQNAEFRFDVGLAPEEGLEPPTRWLTATCSTN